MRFRLEYQMWLVCSLVAFLFILDFSFSRPSQADWKAEWEKTLEAAGKEGRLNVYSTLGPHEMLPQFEKAYP